MANFIFIFSVFVFVMVKMQVHATDFRVGGSNGWTVPASSGTYGQWAEKNRFQVGDTIVFVYNADKDSVLQVNKEDYDKCNTGKPMQSFGDGHTSIKFYESGTHYYISGNAQNCLKGEKIAVTVMAYRGGGSSNEGSSPLLAYKLFIGAGVASSFFLLQHIA